MQLGNLHIGFLNKEQSKAPTSKDVAWSKSQLYSSINIPDYNPDDLLTRKGYRIYRTMMIDEQVKAATIFRRDSSTGREWNFEFDENTKLSEKEQEERTKLFYYIVECMPGSFKNKLVKRG